MISVFFLVLGIIQRRFLEGGFFKFLLAIATAGFI